MGTVSVAGVLQPHSVATLQGTNPWIVQLTSGSVITAGGNSSVQVVGQMPPQSVSGVGIFETQLPTAAALSDTDANPTAPAVGSFGMGWGGTNWARLKQGRGDGDSATGMQNVLPMMFNGTNHDRFRGNTTNGLLVQTGNASVIATQGTDPWNVQPTSGSVFAYQAPGSVMAVSGSFSGGNSSVQLLGGTAMVGSVAAYQGASTPWLVQLTSGSIIAANSSVQVVGTMPPSSVSGVGLFSTNHIGNGSVLVRILQASIAGTYAEDAAHATGQNGLFTLAVRNDTVSSFTSANGDYSPVGVDSAGRTIVKPFAAEQASVWGTASAVSAGTGSGVASVVLFPAAGAGLKNYMTDFMISNTGATTALVTFIDNDNSVLGKTIAPAGGGSNAIGLNFPIVNLSANNRIGMVISNSSSVVHAWAAGFRAP